MVEVLVRAAGDGVEGMLLREVDEVLAMAVGFTVCEKADEILWNSRIDLPLGTRTNSRQRRIDAPLGPRRNRHDEPVPAAPPRAAGHSRAARLTHPASSSRQRRQCLVTAHRRHGAPAGQNGEQRPDRGFTRGRGGR